MALHTNYTVGLQLFVDWQFYMLTANKERKSISPTYVRCFIQKDLKVIDPDDRIILANAVFRNRHRHNPHTHRSRRHNHACEGLLTPSKSF